MPHDGLFEGEQRAPRDREWEVSRNSRYDQTLRGERAAVTEYQEIHIAILETCASALADMTNEIAELRKAIVTQTGSAKSHHGFTPTDKQYDAPIP